MADAVVVDLRERGPTHPVLVLSSKDDQFLIICSHCAARTVRSGFGRYVERRMSRSRGQRQRYGCVVLHEGVGLDDIGEVH